MTKELKEEEVEMRNVDQVIVEVGIIEYSSNQFGFCGGCDEVRFGPSRIVSVNSKLRCGSWVQLTGGCGQYRGAQVVNRGM